MTVEPVTVHTGVELELEPELEDGKGQILYLYFYICLLIDRKCNQLIINQLIPASLKT